MPVPAQWQWPRGGATDGAADLEISRDTCPTGTVGLCWPAGPSVRHLEQETSTRYRASCSRAAAPSTASRACNIQGKFASSLQLQLRLPKGFQVFAAAAVRDGETSCLSQSGWGRVRRAIAPPAQLQPAPALFASGSHAARAWPAAGRALSANLNFL